MSEQGSARSHADEPDEQQQQQSDSEQQQQQEEEEDGEEEGSRAATPVTERSETSPTDGAVAEAAQAHSSSSGVGAGDERDDGDDQSQANGGSGSGGDDTRRTDGDAGTDAGQGPDDDGDGDGEQGDLQRAAAEQLEELGDEADQGSQTNQQQQQEQQQQQRHEQQQQQHGDDDGAYPNGVGSDSYDPSRPQRQVYDDDGGAEPDDPSAADYDGADHGQFSQQNGNGSGGDGGGDGGNADGAAAPAYVMPDILKVVINREELELEAEEEEERELAGEYGPNGSGARPERTPEQVVYVQVIKDNLQHPKAFLGGFRHKYYGTIYHHASSQTARKKKKAENVKFHRETQTVQIISRSQQTAREAGTQMERSDLLQDHSNDVVILSRPYFTADELEALRDAKAKEIQCFLRQCFAWRRVRRLREAKADQIEAEAAALRAAKEREAAEHALQIQRRMHPRTREDFAVLFAELEAWRLHETQRIKESGLAPEEIAAALQELLHKEVKLLQTIDRLKITAARENRWARTQTSLEKMASPKEWSSSEGDLIEVETPFTTRAKELVDLYNGLCLRNLARAQRVDVLLHIKYTVKEFDCQLSREIVELIKREEDLLRRQRSEASLEGLRKRLQNLFLHFVNTPQFNPEAQNFARVPEPTVAAAPPPALSSSLAKPAMLTKTNTVTVASNVAGRIFASKAK